MTPEQLILLLNIINTKTSWGSVQLKTLILEVASGVRTEV